MNEPIFKMRTSTHYLLDDPDIKGRLFIWYIAHFGILNINSQPFPSFNDMLLFKVFNICNLSWNKLLEHVKCINLAYAN